METQRSAQIPAGWKNASTIATAAIAALGVLIGYFFSESTLPNIVWVIGSVVLLALVVVLAYYRYRNA